MRLSALVFFVFLFSVSNAQFLEDFSDGEFTTNPKWSGDTSYFIVNGQNQLQSNGPAMSSEIFLFSNHRMSSNSIWEFSCRMDFSTSTSNHARFYLYSDDSVLPTANYAVYVKIGGESGTDDGVDLYVQNGTVHSKVIDGIAGTIGLDSNEVFVKVIRDYQNLWTLYADTGKFDSYIFQGFWQDNYSEIGEFLGPFCKHSSTRSDKFYFDDISIRYGPFIPLEISVINDSSLDLRFSNPLISTNPISLSDFSLLPQNEHPVQIFSDSMGYTLRLVFDFNLSQGRHVLKCTNLLDNENQSLSSDSVEFTFFPSAKAGTLFINEFMFDPSPTVGIADAEFVEFINISGYPLNLNGLLFGDAANLVELPETIIDTNEFLILCDIKDTAGFSWFGKLLPLEDWPTLNNSGDAIRILSADGSIIDQIEYDLSWTSDNPKSEGGWSFERINPFKKCSSKENWTYSIDGAGGTPGKINSVFDPRPDDTGPGFIGIDSLSAGSIVLRFDENLSWEQVPNLSFIPNLGYDSFNFNNEMMRISFNRAPVPGLVYILQIDTLLDCEGNQSSGLDITFGIGRKPKEFELVITEIMFDPEPENSLPPVEYFEVFNASDSIIELEELLFISGNDSTYSSQFALFPGEYVVLTTGAGLKSFEEKENAIALSPWLALSNEKDDISMYSESFVHSVEYEKNWIRNPDKREGGWSLEMIDAKNPCAGSSNWNASIHPAGGTPGMKNSISMQNPDLRSPVISDVGILSTDSLRVIFSEKVDFRYFHTSNILLVPVTEIESFHSDEIFPEQITLKVKDDLQKNTAYLIRIENIKDCMDNFGDSEFSFRLPEIPEIGDLVINEILFNISEENSEFIEIYNASNKYLDLSESLLLAYNSDGELRSEITLKDVQSILEPGDYLAICFDSILLKTFYPNHGQNIYQPGSFTSLNNDGGFISLKDSSGSIIDSIEFSEDFHFELISDPKNISLERLSVKSGSLDPQNWTSCSESHGFATPGLPNSHVFPENGYSDKISIEPLAFSPDGDSYKDILQIFVESDDPNEILSIDIYDSSGNLIRNLVNSVSVSYANQFFWDGITENGSMARMGNYILVFNFFSTVNGSSRFKKVISLNRNI